MDHHEDEGRVGGGENIGKQNEEEAVARLEEMKKSIEGKITLRQSNLNPERPDSGFLRTLDSSIRRNTAVIKKLKQINEEQREGLLDDLRSVNLSKFVSEAVTSICDAKLRSSDIQSAVQICSLLHQRYKDFSPSLVQGLLKVFFPGKSGDDSDTDRNQKAMKKRSTLKLLLELYFVGVIEDSAIFVSIIKDLTSIEHLKDRDTTQTNLSLLASFARQGRIFLGLPLSGQEVYEEFLKGLNITSDQKKIFRKALHAYYEAASELLQTEHTNYMIDSLAEALDMQPPVMPEDGHTTRVTSGDDASSNSTGKDSSVLEAIWDDEDTRSFYECLPDLRAFVPAVLLGEAESKMNEQSVKTQEQSTELAPESDQVQQTAPDSAEISTDSDLWSFLYRSPETTVRMANMLEILMRLKNVKNLDPRHSTLVENAYYLCKPPERSARIAKVRPPLHQYIRKLLFSDLDKSTIEHVLRQLRKLPWSECEPYLLKCFMKVHRGKYGQIHLIASLTAGLSRYHDEFAVAVVDEVLEEIRVGLELNDYGMQQRRLAHMRFLGELYNYEHVDSSVIFETLYLILVFGHGSPEQDLLDPPEDCFRMRMVITLLETCGHYFDRGSSKRKLDRFLIHFQRYILSKGALPLDIEFDLQDLFADLRPNMTRYSSIEEVTLALVELEEHERTLPSDKTSSEKHSDSEIRSSFNSISANGQSAVNGNEGNGRLHDGLGDSDSDSGSGTLDQEGRDEEELDDENHDEECDTDEEDDDGGGPASDEDEVHVRQKVMEVDPLEAATFEQELKAVMQESMDQRRQELRGRPTLNMMIPMNVFEGSTRGVGGESGDEALDEEGGGIKDVQVKVLVKRGSKQQTRQMYIPRDCSLVQSTKQKEAAELEEKQDIKRLVLEYNDREEEELNGLGTQTLNHMQGSGSRGSTRGHLWEGSSGRGGTRHRHYSGGGIFYNRKK
uniref:MIF4G domain-containing protein n=1 Tax=Cannabis sativa TaxID=3483 RepID=A0A803P209_CANSA